MKSFRVFLTCFLTILIVGGLFAQNQKTSNKLFKCNSREIKVCPDTVVGLTKYKKLEYDRNFLKTERDSLSRQLINVKSQLKEFNIDEFLNIQDTSIFGSKFQGFPLQLISPRNHDYYLLIENLHDLNELLNSKSTGNDYERLQNIRNNLRKAQQKISTISSFATDENRRVFDFLSSVQKQYWQQLKTLYNDQVGMFGLNDE